MIISKMEIHNFRSIRDISNDCSALLTLLGANNHGKSNVLYALEFGLSTSAKPNEQDFFAHRNTSDNELWVQMSFVKLTSQERNTFKRYLLSDNSICIRKTACLVENDIEVSYNGWVMEPEQNWLRSENVKQYLSRDKINQTPLKDFIPQEGRVTKAMIEDAQERYTKDNREALNFTTKLESTNLLGQKNVAGGVLPDFFLIPAVRDLTDEIKIRSTTAFGRLLNRAVKEMAQRDSRFIKAKAQLEEVIASLNLRGDENKSDNELFALERSIEKELESWGVKVNIEVMPPELEKLFELGTDIHLDDGVRTTAERKGHGLQRAMIFALLRSWAIALQLEREAKGDEVISARRQSDSVIFAMEEPELFLHPHAQRRLSDSLRNISETPEHQVFLCTHSTHFVDLSNYKEIAIISKENATVGSEVKQCIDELFEGDRISDKKKKFHMAQWINPDRGEMFFADRVVFVEGETEKVILPFLAHKIGMFDSSVSVIDCGSKHNFPLYLAIANAFSLSYLIVHDEDPLPEDFPAGLTEEKRRSTLQAFRLNESIKERVDKNFGRTFMVSPDFEKASGISRNQSDRKGKALAALDFFDEKSIEEIPDDIVDLVRAAYVNA